MLPVALEAEAARFDHAGMHRADCNLVDLSAINLKVVDLARHDRLIVSPAPGVVAAPVRVVEPDRLEPGMPLRNHPPLLGDLALEPVCLGALRRERGVTIANVGSQDRNA